MKTNILKLGLLFLALNISTSCSKDDNPSTEQNPLTGYLTATGFNEKTINSVDAGDYEFGFSFIPLVNGKIKAIVVKIPDTHLGMRVTIWDKTSGTILRTESIDIPTANIEVIKSITALNLIKDTEYFITFNSNDWYDHRKNDSSNITYPFKVGDIKITSYAYKSGINQIIPINSVTNYYAGDCSFIFQK